MDINYCPHCGFNLQMFSKAPLPAPMSREIVPMQLVKRAKIPGIKKALYSKKEALYSKKEALYSKKGRGDSWTTTDDETLNVLRSQGRTMREIANKLGRTPKAISARIYSNARKDRAKLNAPVSPA